MSSIKISEIDTSKPLTFIVTDGNVEVQNDDLNTERISPVETIAMADKFTERTWNLAQQDEDFKKRLGVIFTEIDITTDERRNLADYPIGFRHVVGLIICTNKALNTGKRPYWVYPETYLHPKHQTGLANLAVMYSNGLCEQE